MPKAFIHAERGEGRGLGRQTPGSPVASAAGRSRGRERSLPHSGCGIPGGDMEEVDVISDIS